MTIQLLLSIGSLVVLSFALGVLWQWRRSTRPKKSREQLWAELSRTSRQSIIKHWEIKKGRPATDEELRKAFPEDYVQVTTGVYR